MIELKQVSYFRCDPINLCNGASCCTSMETKPALSVGDYIRLSKLTGEAPDRIWQEKGDVALYRDDDMDNGEYLILLSLPHDPCP
ncbi:MAG: hypothetical protein QMD85_03870, partial [Candidatus Aenigmarchaeota archaeon]|nr:hypothetical protein [Candidatus Aenigmarchaeota archaeon]MDI6722694.1 hypothetical protein [Candidatus Aenigmarchaeota archaeon]